jgi:type VI secretion system protein ImpJ
MDSIKSLHWKQGLFLKPQHFQQLDTYTAAVSNLYSKVRSGLGAGIAELKFDAQALQTGLLSIEKLQCILDDGTLVAFPGNCQIAPLTLDSKHLDDQGKVEVFVGLAPVAIDQTNLLSKSNANARFLQAKEVNKKDLFDSNEQATLSRLELNCQLLTKSQIHSADGLHLVKIAELQLIGEEYQLSKSYVPKVTLLSGAEALSNMVKATKQELIARYKQLQSISSFELGLVNSSNNLSVGLAMMSISNHVATFTQLEEDPTASPSDVYVAYRQLISQLSMFSGDVSVTGETMQDESAVVAYSQNNLTECFSKVSKLTNKLLNELTIEPELLINLEHQGAAKFVASLPTKFLEANARIYMRIRSKEDISQQLDSVLNYLKVGADGQVDVYLKRALPGVALSYLSKKPQGLATVPNSYYFDLDKQSFQWQKVVEMKRIGVIWNNFPEDVSIELIAVQG